MPIDPGDNFVGALNLGKLDLEGFSSSRNDLVNTIRDPNDFYSFALGTSSSMTISLSGLNGNADLELFNSNGTRIGAPSTNTGTANEVITGTLGEGTYYVRVFSATPGNVDVFYDLSVTRNSGQELDPGSSRDLATDLGTFSGVRANFTQALGGNDIVDYYKIELKETRTLNVALTPSNANADLEVRNSADQLVTGGSSTNSGTAVDRLNGVLSAGVYYIRVFTTPGTATGYRLEIEDTAVDLIGNTAADARDLGLLNQPPIPPPNVVDAIEPGDVDYFKFRLNTLSNFSLTLTGLDGDVDVELRNGTDNLIIARSINGSRFPEAIISRLEAGDYYIRVYPASATASTEFYNLTVFAVPVDSAGSTSNDALNINNQLNDPFAVFRDWVGEIDLFDFYRFDLTTSSSFNLSLSGLTADADVQLLQVSATGVITTVASSTKAGTSDEALNLDLAVGTYYIAVFPAPLAAGSVTYSNTPYRMLVSTSAVSNLLPVETNLGTLGSTVVRPTGTINLNNTADVYRFDLATARSFSLALTGLSTTAPTNVNVRLLRDANTNGIIDDGDELAVSSFGVGTSEAFTLPTLAAGQYFVQVYLSSLTGSSPYTLNLATGTPSVVTLASLPSETLALASFSSDDVEAEVIFLPNDALESGKSIFEETGTSLETEAFLFLSDAAPEDGNTTVEESETERLALT